jgi:hypothetical protein
MLGAISVELSGDVGLSSSSCEISPIGQYDMGEDDLELFVMSWRTGFRFRESSGVWLPDSGISARI